MPPKENIETIEKVYFDATHCVRTITVDKLEKVVRCTYVYDLSSLFVGM